MPRFAPLMDQVWCDVHGCVHDKTTDPYDYGYEQTGEKPECDYRSWRKLWIGKHLTKKEKEVEDE